MRKGACDVNPERNAKTEDTAKATLVPPSAHKAYIAAALLAVLLCALNLACMGEGPLGWISSAALFVFVIFLARRPLVCLILLGSTVLLTLLTTSLAIGSVGLSLVVGTAMLTWLFTVLKRSYTALGVLLIAFAVAYALTGNWLQALLAFAFLPAAALMAHATLGEKGRTASICQAQIGFLLVLVGIVCIVVYKSYGALTLDTVKTAFDDIRTTLTNAMTTFRESFVAMLYEGNAENAAEAEQSLRSMLSDDVINTSVSSWMSLLPAMAAVVFGIVAFEAQLLLGMTYARTGSVQMLTPVFCAFTMSVTAAVLYVVSFLLTLIPFSALPIVALQNLNLVLMPGFCLVGIGVVASYFRAAKGGVRIFLLILVLALLCCGTGYVPTILALWGAYSTVFAVLRARMQKK